MSHKINIGIVWANPYNKNLGVGALAYSSLALLHDALIEVGISANFFFFGGSTTNADVVNFGDRDIPFENIRGFDFYYWKSYIKRHLFPLKTGIKKLKKFDYVFDIGEGDSFADIYGEKRFNRIMNSKVFFNRIRKKQILLPQTIGPFADKLLESKAFAEMSKMPLIISRDLQSYNYTAKFLPKQQIASAIDMAFYLPFKRIPFEEKGLHIGVNISGLLWNGGYTRDNQFKMKTDYRQLVLKALEYFSAMPDVMVHLVPHVIPVDNPVEDDYSASEAIRDQYFRNVIVAPRFSSPIEAKSYIAGLNFFTGARMHSCIAAFSAGVPVIPMAYSRKFNGLFQDTLQFAYMVDCVNEHTEISFEKLKDAFHKREILKSTIGDRLREVVHPKLDILKRTFQNIVKES